MFSCCLPTSRGSGFQKPQGKGFFTCCRHWFKARPRCLRAFGRRGHKSSPQETGQELNDEGLRAPSVKDRKVPHTGNRVQRWLRDKNGSATERNETRVLWTNRADLLEMRITPGARLPRQRPQLHLHIPGHEHSFCHHPEVLDLFFTTYGCILSTSDELGGALEQRNMAISSILGTWLDQYPQDFFQPPEFPRLNVLLTYMGLHMPGSDLERRAQRLLSQLQALEPPEPEAGAPAPERDPEGAQELGPARAVAPAVASEPPRAEPVPAAGAQPLGRAGAPPAPRAPAQVLVRALVHAPALEEPPAPMPDPEVEQGPGPGPGVAAGPEQAPASVEQPAPAPEQQLVLATAPKDGFPSPVTAFFVVFVVCMHLYNGFLYFVR
uniref:ral guanine nucleotide dissociation stimulator-like n=1 Tax=Halichoerus grypus TaxID=9711 RepID=UPI0016596E28|nr:ral guanine nucleotide dissociation stimulator-like [Halichoerus grypus]XP_035953012.1 ral guanine nucleotide dissociation stimulator-like [Halichoerus grypus]XP_035953013.1 ral guanine nucleotide dissociation stimulator-like [Halichoerus grypus]XP_035953014.1 ral guanine nucleotide dissociation stimulator-like [Halichoerus grypus]